MPAPGQRRRDASFVVSAVTLGMVLTREAAVVQQDRPDMYREIADGLRAVWRNKLLRGRNCSTTSPAVCGRRSWSYT